MTDKSPSIRTVCVYCGSSPGHDPTYLNAAESLGTGLAKSGISLVYGGGGSGLMGKVATSCLAGNGQVTGIIPEFLLEWEQNTGMDHLEGAEMIVVPDMHTRKREMFERSDAFIALPGGIGTLEELAEILTWAQLKRHTCPIFVLDINGFWSPMVDLVNHMDSEGFIHSVADLKFQSVKDVASLLDCLRDPRKVVQE